MTTSTAPASPDRPLDMIIFGGAGDLSARKLLPALYMAHTHGNLPPKRAFSQSAAVNGCVTII
ncbi:hypothetical protein PPGU19_038910 [Paraburkholderia sp. PGU19]|nr:hypothetical protein PPGU19_038910 [Paraburkholderia sp. PGU19]